MKKVITLLFLVFLNLSILVSCSQKKEESLNLNNWNSIIENAKGSTVNFYGWGGDEKINQWVEVELSNKLKEEYDITLKRIGMNIDQILDKLLSETAVNAKGNADIIWLNGENFYTAKKNNMLFGPFLTNLPNFNKYLDKNDPETKYDFGFEVEGYEAPYGKAQFVIYGDSSVIKEFPKNAQEFKELCIKYPGKITYPAPPDFVGSAFVRNIIYEFVDYEKFLTVKREKEEVKKLIKPAMDYLIELKPYLWRKGEAYPSSSSLIDNMYSDGELLASMNYNPNVVPNKISTGEFKETTKSFIFENGSIGNTHFLGIPNNSKNISGALVVINEILTPEIQASKYDKNNWGDLPVLDNKKLNDEEKELFKTNKTEKGALNVEFLLNHRLPEMPADIIPIIEEIWYESIQGAEK